MRIRPVVMALAVALGILAAGSTAASAAPANGVSITATINGQALAKASASHPVKLDPSKPATVMLSVVNSGSQPVTLRRVELDGHVLGLSFFDFATSVDLTVAPSSTVPLTFVLDLSSLKGQATGLIGATFTVVDGSGKHLLREATVTHVHGSIASVYGLFGLALLILTLLGLLDIFLMIARQRAPANRWQRGLRTLVPGLGIGLVIAFTLSAASVWVPTTPRWLVLAVCVAAVFFVLGYLSPNPTSEADDDADSSGDDEPVAESDRQTVSVSAPKASAAATVSAPKAAADTVVVSTQKAAEGQAGTAVAQASAAQPTVSSTPVQAPPTTPTPVVQAEES